MCQHLSGGREWAPLLATDGLALSSAECFRAELVKVFFVARYRGETRWPSTSNKIEKLANPEQTKEDNKEQLRKKQDQTKKAMERNQQRNHNEIWRNNGQQETDPLTTNQELQILMFSCVAKSDGKSHHSFQRLCKTYYLKSGKTKSTPNRKKMFSVCGARSILPAKIGKKLYSNKVMSRNSFQWSYMDQTYILWYRSENLKSSVSVEMYFGSLTNCDEVHTSRQASQEVFECLFSYCSCSLIDSLQNSGASHSNLAWFEPGTVFGTIYLAL